MGEYVTDTLGRQLKLGTCEDLFYCRAEQARVFPSYFTPDVLDVVRFRFPWPDEDGIEPGAFGDPFRGMRLQGVSVPEGVEHGLVQFSARNGYLISLQCPEDPAGEWPSKVHRNGYGGACSLIAQGWRGGRLVGIARCNGCERAYRLEDGNEDAAAVAIRAEGDREIRTAEEHGTEGNRDIGERLHLVADRLVAGYALEVARVAPGA